MWTNVRITFQKSLVMFLCVYICVCYMISFFPCKKYNKYWKGNETTTKMMIGEGEEKEMKRMKKDFEWFSFEWAKTNNSFLPCSWAFNKCQKFPINRFINTHLTTIHLGYSNLTKIVALLNGWIEWACNLNLTPWFLLTFKYNTFLFQSLSFILHSNFTKESAQQQLYL